MTTFVQADFWAIPRRQMSQRWSTTLVLPAVAVISVVEAKLHARMSPDVVLEDGLVASWARAAQQQIEHETGIMLSTQTWDMRGDRPPTGGDAIVLPFGPLQSVTSITSYDSATPPVQQTMSSTDYVLDTWSLPGRIGLADSARWPSDLRGFQPLTIRAVVGYASIGLVPEPLLQAVRLAIGWHAMNREPTVIERASYDWLTDPYRNVCVA